MAPGVCVARCQMLVKIDLTRFGLKTLASAQQINKVSVVKVQNAKMDC